MAGNNAKKGGGRAAGGAVAAQGGASLGDRKAVKQAMTLDRAVRWATSNSNDYGRSGPSNNATINRSGLQGLAERRNQAVMRAQMSGALGRAGARVNLRSRKEAAMRQRGVSARIADIGGEKRAFVDAVGKRRTFQRSGTVPKYRFSTAKQPNLFGGSDRARGRGKMIGERRTR